MKTVLAAKPWLVESSLLPFPWRDQQSYLATPHGTKKLKVAILWSDEVVTPHPPVTRALKEVADKLKAVQGVELVDWTPYRHDEAWEIIASLYFCDGANEDKQAIDASGEPWRPLSNFIVKENPFVRHHSIEDVWHWTEKREGYRREYSRLWNGTATGTSEAGELEGMVDVILCPVGPGAAPLLDSSKYWGYTSQWNVLDYPALVFPVSKVDPAIDVVDQGYRPLNEKDEFNYHLCQCPPAATYFLFLVVRGGGGGGGDV